MSLTPDDPRRRIAVHLGGVVLDFAAGAFGQPRQKRQGSGRASRKLRRVRHDKADGLRRRRRAVRRSFSPVDIY